MPQIPTLPEFLLWLANGGLGGATLALLLERIPAFQRLSSLAKVGVVFGLSALIGVGAACILEFVPAEVLLRFEPFWRAIAIAWAVTAGTWLSSQVAHRWDTNGRKGNGGQ